MSKMGKFVFEVQEIVEQNAFESFDVIQTKVKESFAPEYQEFAIETAKIMQEEILYDWKAYSL